MKNVAIDFEFKRPADPDMGLISCALYSQEHGTERFWLWSGDEDRERLLARVEELARDGFAFIGYSIQQAEARCIAAMGMNPNRLLWRDLMIEWRWLRNGDNRWAYGRIVGTDGTAMFTVPPRVRVGKKASQDEIDFAEAENAQYLEELRAGETFDGEGLSLIQAGWSLLDCEYFFSVMDLAGYRNAATLKARVRDEIIIRGTAGNIEAHRQIIQDYNSQDVSELLTLADKITEAMAGTGEDCYCCASKGTTDYLDFDAAAIREIQLSLGDWSARLGKYGQRGIPLHRGRLERLLQVVPKLTQEERDTWVYEHPDTPLYRIGLPSRILECRSQALKMSPYGKGQVTRDESLIEGLVDEFCRTSGLTNYPRTRTGKVDTSKRVIARYAAAENLLKQFERHQGHLSSLKTYSPNAQGHVDALNYIGSDDRQRPDFGPYGTQTARNAAKAKSLCFLGPHWMRVLCDPEPGMALIDLDFASQEIWIAAVLGDDDAMKAAYLSEDFYVASAQNFGMYPQDLPIPSEAQRNEPWFAPYKKIRNIAKTLCLSMQFGAGARSVAAAVRDATHDPSVTDEQGQDWMSDYASTYASYSYFVQDIRRAYQQGLGLSLPGGWRMGKDNPSVISASNFPIQGTGSVILQRACKLIDDAGFTVLATLHDAITIYAPSEQAQETAVQCSALMRRAAQEILGAAGMKVGRPEIIHHGELWLHSDRAKKAWDKLSESFSGTF